MKSLSDQISNMINSDRRTNAKRTEKVIEIKRALDNPMRTLEDDAKYLCEKEEEFLGVSLTYSLTDTIPINTAYECSTVLENAKPNSLITLVGQVSRWNEIKTKSGKNPGQLMCFITIEDSSGRLDVVCFPSSYNVDVKACLYQSSLVVVTGKVSKDRKSFIVEEIKQAE